MKSTLTNSIKFCKEHPILGHILLCALPGSVCGLVFSFIPIFYDNTLKDVVGTFIFTFIVIGFFISYPIAVTVYNFIKLLSSCCTKGCIEDDDAAKGYDYFVIFVAIIYSAIYISLLAEIIFVDWSVQLHNQQHHSPISLDTIPTILTIFLVSLFAMIILQFTPSRKRPPLITVLSIAGLYMGDILICFLGIQLIPSLGVLGLLLLLVPANIIMIHARILVKEVKGYVPDESRMDKIRGNSFLSRANKLLLNSKNWPILGILFILPVLGILIAILALFGQAPDAVIKAFTETADYTFSTKIPPQNLYYDEHYLCTVAAGGHEKIVKPLRMGKRHGHDVVVNRQLCVANAFEQILEEKTPTLHKHVRGFYDKYGFPIARLIKSKWVADLVWFIMKPLEWFFLIVLYLVDVHPEDRIARQYTK